MSEKEFIVWVDKETTGFNPGWDVILELGIKVTDKWLNVKHEKSWLVRADGWLNKFHAAALPVKEMHTKSGLYDELMKLPEEYVVDGQKLDYSEPMVSYLAYQWLTDELGLGVGKYPMAGSSVHFDRSFAKARMPVFDSFFSYRHIDVSSIKELCEVFRPGLRRKMEGMPEFQKSNATHRVLDDIDASIRELKYYDNQGFIVRGV